VRGEFTGWATSPIPMVYQGGTLWVATVRLRTNPTGVGIPGAYQYKFYYNGVTTWPNDPLNHHVNPSDNDNSFIIMKDPTIYHFLPNQRTGSVTTDFPTISAYIFPRVGGSVDTASLALTIDGIMYSGIGSNYNSTTRQLTYTPTSPAIIQ